MSTEHDILLFYRDLNMLLTRRFKDCYCSYNLTMPQVLVLDTLDRHGPMMMSELARLTNSTNSTISGVVDRLERTGMVQRVRDEGDRRRVTVECTEQFAVLKAHATTDMQEVFHNVFGQATSEDKACIIEGLSRMRQLLEAARVTVE